MEIFFNNDTQYNLDKNIINMMKKAIITTLSYEKFEYDAEISLSIVSNIDIKKLNKEYRNIDKETDVLSFPMMDMSHNLKNSLHHIVLGDIIISIDKAMAQAKEYDHSLQRELCFLAVHSTLHLLGYDHMSENDEKIMMKKQDDILKMINVNR